MSSQLQSGAQTIAKKLIPTGQEIKDYFGYESWTNIRWAWEFLRRNTDYQQYCRDAATNGAQPRTLDKEVKRNFGLMRYKHFLEDFDGPGLQKVKFVTSSVRTWSRVTKIQIAKGRTVRVAVNPGQVLILFDVRHASKSTKSMASQLSNAKNLLQKREDQWKQTKKSGSIVASGRGMRHHRQDLITLIRLLDLRQYREQFDKTDPQYMTNGKMLEVADPKSEHHEEPDKRYQELINRARQYVDVKYLDLAATTDPKQ